MRRDMDLVRTLLLKVEEMPAEAGATFRIGWSDPFFEIEGWDRDTAVAHFALLMDAGFIRAAGRQGLTEFVIHGMSWEGHDLADRIRRPAV